MCIRNEIERVIKERQIDRSRCFECSKTSYQSIIKKIEQTFVSDGGAIHWSNMGRFHPKWVCKTKNISDDRMWVEKLPDIIPESGGLIYALFEDVKNFEPKYWVYEMCIPELICVVGEVNGLDDFYIVSKKFDWLISECHEDIVSFVGSGLNLSCFEKGINGAMLKPKHLEKIFAPTDDEGTEGEIVCTCGCRAFKIRCFGEFYDKNKMAIHAYEDKYGQAVRAVCAECGMDHLLYDFALHGYDGLLCTEGIAIPDESLKDFRTETDNLFEVKMFLEYDDEEQFFEEVVSDEYVQKEFHITMADRASVWSWVVIELKGVCSGVIYRDFVNQELA